MNVSFMDMRTGAEESSAQLRSALSREATQEIPRIVSSTQLRKAEGTALVNIQGCGEPYLVKWSDWKIPKLSSLIGAAGSWNMDELRKILAEGMNVNAREIGTGRTALIWAAVDPRKGALYQMARERGSREPDDRTVKFLLQVGADPNAKDVDGETALMRADSSTARLLLAAGADTNARDNRGRTPLMYAAQAGDGATIRLELAAHADVSIVDRNGWSALMYAVGQCSLDATRALLGAGANSDARNDAHQTALMIAQQGAKQNSDCQALTQILSQHR